MRCKPRSIFQGQSREVSLRRGSTLRGAGLENPTVLAAWWQADLGAAETLDDASVLVDRSGRRPDPRGRTVTNAARCGPAPRGTSGRKRPDRAARPSVAPGSAPAHPARS